MKGNILDTLEQWAGARRPHLGARGVSVSATRGRADRTPPSAWTAAQRASVQGLPCVDCGAITSSQVADHITPLVQEWYETGQINTEFMHSLEAVQPQCPACSALQGGQLSWYSRAMREVFFGKDAGGP